MSIPGIITEPRVYLLFALILLLGVITSYSDVKKEKIENRFVLPCLAAGILINLSYLDLAVVSTLIINLLFATMVAIVLWYVGFWNAGDGKLLIAFTSLVPMGYYLHQGIRGLYSYQIIFYTFVPIFFALLVLLIIRTKLREVKYTFKEYVKARVIFLIMLAFFSFQWVLQIFQQSTGIRVNFFVSVLVLFFIFDALEKVLPFRIVNIFGIVAVSRFFLDYQTIFTKDFLVLFLIRFSIFLILVYFILHLAYVKYGKHVKISDLKPGMLLSEIIYKKGKVYSVRPNVQISLFMFLRTKVKEKPLIEVTSRGLTKRDIEMLQKLYRKGKLEVDSLLIQKRMPFAPFLLLGVVIFILARLFHFF